MYNAAPVDPPLTFASGPAPKGHYVGAIVLVVLGSGATLVLLPYLALQGPLFPGFLLMNQTALLGAYALGAWVL